MLGIYQVKYFGFLLSFTVFFGGLGVGSLWKPDSIGAIASQLLRNLAKSGEEESDSHNKQIQKKSSGSVQVMASDRAEVNINVPSVKKNQAQKPSAEEEPSRTIKEKGIHRSRKRQIART
jgi:hypothetical protein